MKKRLFYAGAFLLLLGAEVWIGVFVRDDLIRPYVGDLLVTVLLCCLCRIVLPDKCGLLPLWVFLFALGVECVQLLDLSALEGTVLGIILGSTFDWADILCYGMGCAAFWGAELFLKKE